MAEQVGEMTFKAGHSSLLMTAAVTVAAISISHSLT